MRIALVYSLSLECCECWSSFDIFHADLCYTYVLSFLFVFEYEKDSCLGWYAVAVYYTYTSTNLQAGFESILLTGLSSSKIAVTLPKIVIGES